MKLLEYFYMGKPVISVPINELRRLTRYVSIQKTWNTWECQIKHLQSSSWLVKYKKEQKLLAQHHSWENKIKAIYSHII